MRTISCVTVLSILVSLVRADEVPVIKPDQLRKINNDTAVALTFSPDGKLLAYGAGRGQIRIIEFATGKYVLKADRDKYTYALAFAPRGNRLFVCTEGEDIYSFVLKEGTWVEGPSLKGHKGTVTCLAMSPDGETLASGGYDRTIRLWDWKQNKLRRILGEHEGRVVSISFSPDGKKLAAGATGIAKFDFSEIAQSCCPRIWDLDKPGRPDFIGIRGDVVRFSPDGRTLLLNDRSFIDVNTEGRGPVSVQRPGGPKVNYDCYDMMYLLDETTGAPWLNVNCRGDELICSPDGTLFLTGTGSSDHMQGSLINGGAGKVSDSRLGVWDGVKGLELFRIGTRQPNSMAFSPCGSTLVWGASWGENVHGLWECNLHRIARFLALKEKLLIGDLDSYWGALESPGRLGWIAAQLLASERDGAVSIISRKFKKSPSVSSDEVNRLLIQLDSGKYAERQVAEKALIPLSAQYDPLLRQTRTRTSSAQVRQSLDRIILSGRIRPLGNDLRFLRSIQVLAQINIPEARAVLNRLATGPEELLRTQAARSAVDRLRHSNAVSEK